MTQVLVQQLVTSIQDCLKNQLSKNAIFLAERLLAECDTEETRSLLADCYIQNNKYYKAYYILQKKQSEINRYKLALCCFKLNKLQEAERILLATNPRDFVQGKYNMNFPKYESVPNGSFGLYLLGQVYERNEKNPEAVQAYFRALEVNPTLWVAYERLCKLGQKADASKIFGDFKFKAYEKKRQKEQRISGMQQIQVVVPDDILGLQQGSNSNKGQQQQQSKGIQSIQQGKKFGNIKTQKQPQVMKIDLGVGVSPKPKFSKNIKLSKKQNPNQKPNQIELEAQQSSESHHQNQRSKNSFSSLMELLTKFGKAYYLFSTYNCAEAIDLFQQFPENHQISGWVQKLKARCYFERMKYIDAEIHFKKAFQFEPYNLEGIEYYSSCLWHLKKKVELCTLAYQALEQSIFAPETWIVVGNCYSLQKEHENALKFFDRAIKLDPQMAYAHCLSGHEYVYNENFDKARLCFRYTLNIDYRHYNAYWGLGNICFKQEKFDKAIEYFQNAIQINNKCSVLFTYLGMTYTSKGKYYDAYKQFRKAEDIDPTNCLNKFQKATVLMKIGKNEVALKELEDLKQRMPKEAPIMTLMGNIYAKMGNKQKAHDCYTLAMDLDSKDTQRIKGYIDSLNSDPGNDFMEDNLY